MRKSKLQLKHSLPIVLVLLTAIALIDIQVTSHEHVQAICEQSHSDMISRNILPLIQKGIGKALYAYDFTTGKVLYEKNAQTPLPLASLTKLMTVRIALEDDTDPNAYYALTSADLAPDGSIGFSTGQRFTVPSLAYAALIPSSNDAAEALMHTTHLSDSVFFDAMDSEARKLGLSSLSYHSATGLDNDDGTASSYGSAQDIAALLYKDSTDYPQIFSATTHPSSSIISEGGTTIPLISTDLALQQLPLLTAGKTGYTLTAGGNLAIVWKADTPNHDMIGATVLGSTEDGRFDDMVLLYNVSNTILSEDNNTPAICK